MDQGNEGASSIQGLLNGCVSHKDKGTALEVEVLDGACMILLELTGSVKAGLIDSRAEDSKVF